MCLYRTGELWSVSLRYKADEDQGKVHVVHKYQIFNSLDVKLSLGVTVIVKRFQWLVV